jgi:hypothetical protein
MIHFVTPLYRYNNLNIIYSTIFNQIENFKWHLIEGSKKIGDYDLDSLLSDDRIHFYKMKTNYIYGHEQRNFFIKNIKCNDNDWCYFLDDDNIITKDLVDEINDTSNLDVDVIYFSQKKGLTEQQRLWGYEGHMKLGTCDIGSFLIKYNILKNTHIPYFEHRNADGHYCEQISKIDGVRIKYKPEKFVRYNSLSTEIT